MKSKTERPFILAMFMLFAALSKGADFDSMAFGKDLGGWEDKSGNAAKIQLGRSNYRVYRPSVSEVEGGSILISTTINHIRRWASDDRCRLDITFSKDGRLTAARAVISLGGEPFDTGTIAEAAVGQMDAQKPMIPVKERLVAMLSKQIAKANGNEGRARIPTVMIKAFNLVEKNIKK